MKTWPTLLRVLLSIALILNGIGGAVAATRMATGPASAEAMARAAEAPRVTDMPCHPHHGVPASHGPGAGEPASPVKVPGPDCCKTGACTCACAQVAQVALSAFRLAAPVLEQSPAPRRLSLAYATPALPPLIRPPIG